MNASPDPSASVQSPAPSRESLSPVLRGKLLALLLAVSLIAGWLAIGNDSLWIDEGNAAAKAILPSWGQWVETMRAERGSDAQMPLYMAWLWAWEKGAGRGEAALRFGNLPWLLLGHGFLLAALLRSRRGSRIAVLYTAAAAVSPFLCYYLNEARPYAMQYGAACLVLAYLLDTETSPARAFQPGVLAVGLLGVFLLIGSSLLGVPWAGSAFLALCWILWTASRNGIRIARPPVLSLALLALLAAGIAGLGYYYLLTLKAGAGASNVAKTSFATMLFAGYEFAGLSGLGPNRAVLRDSGIGALLPYAPRLALGFLILGAAGMTGVILRIRQSGKKYPPAWMLLAVVLPAAFLFALGVASHFRLLGRHLMPALPLLLLWVSLAMASLFRSRLCPLAVFCLAVWAASALFLRFSPDHRKDDYRDAASLAREALANGKRVWWAADQSTGRYYSLDFTGAPRLMAVANFPAEALAKEPEPNLVCLSKRDIYDNSGTLGDYLSAHGFVVCNKFPAFTVFEKRR